MVIAEGLRHHSLFTTLKVLESEVLIESGFVDKIKLSENLIEEKRG